MKSESWLASHRASSSQRRLSSPWRSQAATATLGWNLPKWEIAKAAVGLQSLLRAAGASDQFVVGSAEPHSRVTQVAGMFAPPVEVKLARVYVDRIQAIGHHLESLPGPEDRARAG
jgi:hypothetical protein